jgi:UDP-GlcNAc:undecaprenyl-phosphate GlcNAc-1-phosphate transferase
VTLFFSFIIALFVTMVLIPPLMRKAKNWQFVDMPDQRKIHVNAVPRIGGVAMVVGSVLPMMMWLMPNQSIISLLLGILVIVIFGVWDDRKNIDYRLKFLGQIIAVAIVMFYGGIRIDTVPFAGLDPVPVYISLPLTFLFLLGITNAINLSDGLDGLAGGTTLLSFGIIALLGFLEGNAVVLLTSIAVLGSILGFLRFNTHPARIFMGDGGSQFLGFSVGVLAVMLTQGIDTALSPALPVLLLGLPILDTLLVMGQRVYEGRSPFKPDRNHIHHKLLALGLDHYEAVVIIYAFQSLLVIAAYYLRYNSDAVILGFYLVFCTFIAAGFRLAHVTGWKFRISGNEHRPLLARGVKRLRHYQHSGKITAIASHIVATSLPVYILAGILTTEEVSMDIGILALFSLAAIILFQLKIFMESGHWLERASAYLLCTLIVYLNHPANSLEINHVILLINSYFVLLAVAVVVGFHFSKSKEFSMTPLDFLVIFIAFTIPNLPGLEFGQNIGVAIAKIIVMFYAVELILSQLKHRSAAVKSVMIFMFAILASKAFLFT